MLLFGGDVDVINELRFRNRSRQLDEFLRGDYRSMSEELRKAFPKTQGIQERYVPLVQRFAHEQSSALYARPVVRRFGDATLPAPVFQKLRQVYTESRIDVTMLHVHRELLIQQTVIMVPMRDLSGSFHWHVFSPWQFEIEYDDVLHAYNLQAAKSISCKVPVQNEAGAVVYGKMYLSKTEAWYEDGKGGIIPLIGNSIEHTLGMIPAVGIRAEDPMPGRFEAPINDALLNAAIALMINESDTELLVHTQAWGQRVLEGAQLGQMVEELQVGPEKVLALYSMDPTAPAPSLKIVQGQPPLSQITAWNESRLRLLCSMFDLSPDAFLKNNTSTTATARAADARDRVDSAQRFIPIFEVAESQMLRLMIKVMNTTDPLQLPEDVGVSLRFAKFLPYADPLHEAQAVQLQIQSGTLSPIEYLMSRDGLSREGARQRIRQNQREMEDLFGAPASGGTASTDGAVQDTAMNGAQVQQLVSLVMAISQRQIDGAAARDLIGLAFPLLPAAQIEQMVGKAQQFKPAMPEAEQVAADG